MFRRKLILAIFCNIFFLFAPSLWDRIHAQSTPWVAPASANAVRSPLTINQAALKDAKTLYSSYCLPCHGDKGRGDGIAAAALNPKPADYTSSIMKNESDGIVYYKISEGRLPMPQFKTTLTENQRWELVAYIRTLSNAGKK